MPNPTRQEIINAHEALDGLTYLAESFALSTSGERGDIKKLRQTTLAALPPKPKPTMAEIEWDDDKHRFAEAEHPDYGEVIMLGKSWVHEQIDILVNNDQGIGFQLEYPADLTPTGRRYTLTEEQE